MCASQVDASQDVTVEVRKSGGNLTLGTTYILHVWSSHTGDCYAECVLTIKQGEIVGIRVVDVDQLKLY